MMTNPESLQSSNSENESKEAQRVLQKFLRRIWQHPLWNEALEQHRLDAVKTFNRFLLESRLGLEHYVGVLCGSSVWAIEKGSDYDFYPIARTDSDRKKFQKLDESLWEGLSAKLRSRKLSYLPFFGVGDRIGDEPHAWRAFCALLLTPDRYIGGNVELARRIRLHAVNELIRNPHFQSAFETFFQHQMVGWKKITFRFPTFGFGSPFKMKKDLKRAKRFSRVLTERAKNFQNPEKAGERLVSAIDAIRLPNFHDLQKVLRVTKGKLEVKKLHEV